MTARHRTSRAVFLRALGLVYAFSFASLGRQAAGLFGPRGIQPIGAFLDAQRGAFGASAPLRSPSLFWLTASDVALQGAAWTGVLSGLLLALGCESSVVLGGAWLLHLSFVNTGQAFAGSPFDLLLVEAGFLSIFLSSSLSWKAGAEPARPVVFLFRWLLFRALFGVGVARLRSDPCWSGLTCLPEYLETEPAPTIVGYYVHALPIPVHRVLGFAALFSEIVVPFGFFGPRRVRTFAGVVTFAVSALSALVANGHSSLLVMALSVLFFDDAVFDRVTLFRRLLTGLELSGLGRTDRDRRGGREPREMPAKPAPGSSSGGAGRATFEACRIDSELPKAVRGAERRGFPGRDVAELETSGGAELDRVRFVGVLAVCAVLFTLSLLLLPRMLSPAPGIDPSLEPFHLVSVYGVIEPVERTRTEVVFEGTRDDVAVGPAHWLEYELPCEPGDPMRPPCLPSLYLRRLDERLWQAALGDFRREPWVVRVVDDLLRENPAATGLFAHDPFAGKPPRFVRAERYRYRFSKPGEPGYWRRERLDDYLRPFSLEDPALYEYLFRRGWLRGAGTRPR